MNLFVKDVKDFQLLAKIWPVQVSKAKIQKLIFEGWEFLVCKTLCKNQYHLTFPSHHHFTSQILCKAVWDSSQAHSVAFTSSQVRVRLMMKPWQCLHGRRKKLTSYKAHNILYDILGFRFQSSNPNMGTICKCHHF